MARWSNRQVKNFADAAQSLKLYRRAELVDDDTQKSLIEDLYVDPLPADGILNALVRANTSFLIGRKGTGKSTVFQRAQHEIRKQKASISAYLDIKTIFESSDVDPVLLDKLGQQPSALPPETVKQFLLYESFVRAVLLEIRAEMKKQIDATFLSRLREKLLSSSTEIFEALDELIENTRQVAFADITGQQTVTAKNERHQEASSSTKANAKLAGGIKNQLPSIDVEVGASGETAEKATSKADEEFSRVLLRTFNIKGLIGELADLLSEIGITRLYIFIDDFSELPEDAMVVFVDSVLAPLNNWSNELIKFKVAAYPGRIYYGQIDKTKIDELYLDPFKLYGTNDVSNMEEKAIDFTTRVVNTRLKYFCDTDLATFSDSEFQEITKHLFFATMGNPRNLGHILYNLHESHLVYDKAIGTRAIRDAARKYYEEKIEPFFGIQKFRLDTFKERSSIFSLKELLEKIVVRARELRSYRESTVMKTISGRPPTSHFHVLTEFDALLSTLELNFFLTKYFEMKDRDGRKVSVFALNFGLCEKHSIEFGRPAGKREYRLYFVERIFDDTSIIKQYLEQNQEIKCQDCGAIFGLDKLDGLKLYGMSCPTCRTGTCVVTNLSRRYETILENVQTELLLPATELGILETLHSEDRDLAAAEIAADLDCSYQLVGRRGKILEEKGLVDRLMQRNRRRFRLTETARGEYFRDNESRELDLPDG
ncbi:methyltransferase family protein [Bradyrhizobium amphicarpaeae]|uniref:ArsR family transcriptional regulator n=1 Tax=Bradyrhizobium amphicarpaeae TaxID=1404768 RepID=A0A2U8PW41_9BRAD|nr:winged helix-turn-helix domain-containing protein [Bradyrhizobium amphicarpaeae]AWM01398.1 ArsR family transcriptional regulator [Bradyrhizobium amphicarpaeae]